MLTDDIASVAIRYVLGDPLEALNKSDRYSDGAASVLSQLIEGGIHEAGERRACGF